MIDTLMALWNRDSYSRAILALFALLSICISISLLFVTVNNAVSHLLQGGGSPHYQGETAKIAPTMTATATATPTEVMATPTPMPTPTLVIAQNTPPPSVGVTPTPVPTQGGNKGTGGGTNCPTPTFAFASPTPTAFSTPGVTPIPEPTDSVVTPTPSVAPDPTVPPSSTVTPVPPSITVTPEGTPAPGPGFPPASVTPVTAGHTAHHIVHKRRYRQKSSVTPQATPTSQASNTDCDKGDTLADNARTSFFQTTLLLLGGGPVFGTLGFLTILALYRRRTLEK
jgi:hypothetical protein